MKMVIGVFDDKVLLYDTDTRSADYVSWSDFRSLANSERMYYKASISKYKALAGVDIHIANRLLRGLTINTVCPVLDFNNFKAYYGIRRRLKMYSIKFYKDKDEKEPLKEYLKALANKADKDSRININKIRDYVAILKEYGTMAGEPYMKHLEDEIWELRPLRNRILFFAYDGKTFILLSHFIKKTQKTPRKEIETAKKLLSDYKERN